MSVIIFAEERNKVESYTYSAQGLMKKGKCWERLGRARRKDHIRAPSNGSYLIAILMVRLAFKRLLSVTLYISYLSTLGANEFSRCALFIYLLRICELVM